MLYNMYKFLFIEIYFFPNAVDCSKVLIQSLIQNVWRYVQIVRLIYNYEHLMYK